MNMYKVILTIFIIFFCSVVLTLSIRGIAGTPTQATITDPKWSDNGPFELSPDRGRFALTFSLVENHSFYFSLPVARFATPDLGFKNGHYVSLFAPLVSYVIIPGYMVGKLFSLGQVGAFAIISFFAILNTILIRVIAEKLGARPLAATLAALTFLFATPAYTYAVTLYQHHISTFLILLSIYILLRWKNMWSLFFVWFLFAASLPMDNPNLFLMFPIVIYALKRLIEVKSHNGSYHVSFKLLGVITFAGAILPLAYFLWFNQMSYGSPFQLGGTVAGVKAIDATGQPVAPKGMDLKTAELYTNPSQQHKSAVQFFQTRNMINGLYEHLISPDRGMLYFTPVMFISLFGIVLFYKRKVPMYSVFLGIICVDLLLYSMWGDPYGGWAFGSRYLIPSYAILAIFLSLALSRLRKNALFLGIFFIVLSYSVCVNTLGAITSSSNPPQVEVLALEQLTHQPEKYSYDRNIDLLIANKSKSFVWQTYFQHTFSALVYYYVLILSLMAAFAGIMARIWMTRNKEDTL